MEKTKENENLINENLMEFAPRDGKWASRPIYSNSEPFRIVAGSDGLTEESFLCSMLDEGMSWTRENSTDKDFSSSVAYPEIVLGEVHPVEVVSIDDIRDAFAGGGADMSDDELVRAIASYYSRGGEAEQNCDDGTTFRVPFERAELLELIRGDDN